MTNEDTAPQISAARAALVDLANAPPGPDLATAAGMVAAFLPEIEQALRKRVRWSRIVAKLNQTCGTSHKLGACQRAYSRLKTKDRSTQAPRSRARGAIKRVTTRPAAVRARSPQQSTELHASETEMSDVSTTQAPGQATVTSADLSDTPLFASQMRSEPTSAGTTIGSVSFAQIAAKLRATPPAQEA